MKEGIYKPGTDRSSTFSLMGGIAIYGGFAGVETSRDQRDPSAHLTVLSGDLNGDDNGNIASDEPARAENAFHVVSSGGNGNTAILDGFTISGGNANLDSGTHTARGGGMWNGNGSPTLTNVTFAGNTSLELGGGMFNENNSRPTLTNVSFLNNSSEGGGGLANHRSTPILTNVVFVNNNASYSGGGALNLSESHATFTNVTFTGNSAFSFGGGMSSYDSNPSVLSSTFVYNTAFGNDHPFHTYDQTPPFGGGMYNYHSNTVIVNSTFSNNRAESERDPIAGSGMGNQESDPILTHVTISEDRDGIVNDASHPVVRNSIIWVNSFLVGAIAIVDANNSNSVVSDSVIWNGFPGGTNIIIADPLLGELGNYGGHTQMVPLQPGSSAIDTGSSSDCPVTDQRNVARPQGGGCDIGAFEYTEGPSVTVTPSPVTPITSVTSTLTPNPTPTATYTLIPTLAFTPTPISSGGTAVVSANTGGALGNGESLKPFISADGRYVTFYSEATNLVSGDTTQNTDVFLRDNLTGIMERVSVSSSGIQGNSSSYSPSVSADGRYVVFGSISYTLVPGDTNSSADIFIRDRQTGLTECVSVTTSGVPGNGISSDPAISANGRYVAFSSSARNLVVGDTTVASDIFVRDIQTETTTRVSVGSNGTEANSASYGPSISADGRYVAFESYATNLVQDDTNGTMDIFVHDRETGITTRVSVDSNAVEANSSSINPSISANGRYVVFSSLATNLVSGDTNGETGSDIFIHDMQTGVTKRVSVDSN
ncbi:MAG TPA: choice-of-anchor Q domain-containing protein, partial [Anaerolineales bacterium]|nr:choice-of-anchor Q domain-containing protein [Anaerolineales bacterium]